ncbi:hypothetical protein F4V43_02185 [Paenibacillus spiritus]|uniref:Uncharacterized protein n=1 Tax=Paenibacillus spiritus TaxID=2496557 RepID=A0A5J5GGI0_9BACL|nr:hypothetical protein [Paenibacillus spiritus]KAA9007316.1 hypothetical protein F4V43_02185 [Paenibacillus spiritus]
MILNKTIIEKAKSVAVRAGGYLTVDLFNRNRGDLPVWETLKKTYDINFSEFLKECEILDKEQYTIKKNRTNAISNLKLLALEHGEVSKVLYDKSGYSPSSDYISKHYGWEDMCKTANVKIVGGYITLDAALDDLKKSIKELGYVPTSKEYESLRLKPTVDALKKFNVTWTVAMRKAGFSPYGQSVSVKDKICIEHNCYRQFTPSFEGDKFCEECFKKYRAEVVRALKSFDYSALVEICKKFIYTNPSQSVFFNAIGSELNKLKI